jgi:hypothetical protein
MKKPTQKETLARYRRALVKLDSLTSAHEYIDDNGRLMATRAPKVVDAGLVWMAAHGALDDLDPQQAVLDCLEQDVIALTEKWMVDPPDHEDALMTAVEAMVLQRAKMADKAREERG